MTRIEKKLNCVLLVDDDDIVNHLHKNIIEGEGLSKHIQVADSVNLAIDLLNCPKVVDCKNPDLILLDLNMPGLNGWDFLDTYHELQKEKGKNSLIIILTNSHNPYDKKKAESYSEVVGFRSKPLTDLMLHEIVDRYFT